MAVQITNENLAYYLDMLSDSLENAEGARGCIVVTDLDTMKKVLVIPGVKYTKDPIENPDAVADEYVQIPYSVLADALEGMQTATTAANTATANAYIATTYAEKVNATLEGMLVTITDRNGNARSTNIGFEIYATYPSVAAMNAQAANVPEGKFVVIATEDPTDPENARLYVRNNQAPTASEPFDFLSDLDQASSSAWADWLDNMKPEIQAAIDTADADHTQAVSDHTTAVADHTTAQGDHTQAGTDHTQYSTDHQTFLTNEQTRQTTFETNEAQRQQDFEDAEAERMATMILTRCYIDFTDMSLMFVEPEDNVTDYKVQNGNLKITIQYDE